MYNTNIRRLTSLTILVHVSLIPYNTSISYSRIEMKKENKKESGTPLETKIFGTAHAYSVVHFALNFPRVLFFKVPMK